jgi:hypothetical protein
MIALFSFQAEQNSTKISSLLNAYYEVKNALISSDITSASAKANLFIRTSNNVNIKAQPSDKLKSVLKLQRKLNETAAHIAVAKDLSAQREYFAAFSQDFYELAKAVSLSEQPIYQAYCPMKKMYWLSNETTIKNPYYGNAMLNCGSITATIKP